METYIPMYNENDKTDLTGTESETTENNDNSSGTYGGSFKDYTYSTYDYSSFYDENYSNSYDKANNTTDNSENQTSYNSTVDELDDNKVSETLSDDSDSIDSFKIFDNLNSVDSFEALDCTNSVNTFNSTSNNLNNSTNNSQQTVPPDEDATIYLDDFWNEAVNYNNSLSNSQKRQNKYKRLNIPGVTIVSIGILSMVLIAIGAICGGNVEYILTGVGPVMFVLALMSAIILDTFTKYKMSIFIINPDFLQNEIPSQNIDLYLNLTGKKSFRAQRSYCLTAPSVNERPKVLCVKYALLTVLTVFAIGNIISYIKYGPQWSDILALDAVLLFPCIGICMFYIVIEQQLQQKSGYYDETVDAVCVEVDSRISRNRVGSGHSTRVYRPILYTRCKNGHKYILMNNVYTNTHIPYIGEVYKLKVNSRNPLCYVQLESTFRNAFFWFSILWIALSGLGYIFVLFNATF